jgi:hypothetical protein
MIAWRSGARFLAIMLLLMAGLLQGRPVAGQASRADSAAVLLDAASRFEREGQNSVANAIYRQILQRFGDTPAAASARSRLGLMETPQGLERSGRAELAVFTTLYGLWLGVAVPAALDANDPEPYGLGLLLGGPAGLFSGLAYARSRSLTEGQARAITFGGTWGTWQGFGWARVADIGEGLDCVDDVCTSDSTQETFAMTIAGGLAGIVAGAIISQKSIPQGLATTVNFGALWGTWFGVATGVIADLEDDGLLASALIGGDAGLIATAILAPGWNLSRPRARLISISGVLGGLAGAGIDLLAQPDNEDVAIGIPLATSIAGLILGTYLTRTYDSGSARDGGAEEALLHIEDGRVRLGPAMPFPVLEARERAGRVGWHVAAHVPLLAVRF